jgi:hypothetical protein
MIVLYIVGWRQKIRQYSLGQPWLLGGDGLLTNWAASIRLVLTVEVQCLMVKFELVLSLLQIKNLA